MRQFRLARARLVVLSRSAPDISLTPPEQYGRGCASHLAEVRCRAADPRQRARQVGCQGHTRGQPSRSRPSIPPNRPRRLRESARQPLRRVGSGVLAAPQPISTPAGPVMIFPGLLLRVGRHRSRSTQPAIQGHDSQYGSPWNRYRQDSRRAAALAVYQATGAMRLSR